MVVHEVGVEVAESRGKRGWESGRGGVVVGDGGREVGRAGRRQAMSK